MIALPENTTVYAGGRTWEKEIPEELCPDHLKPAPTGKGAKPTAEGSK